MESIDLATDPRTSKNTGGGGSRIRITFIKNSHLLGLKVGKAWALGSKEMNSGGVPGLYSGH